MTELISMYYAGTAQHSPIDNIARMQIIKRLHHASRIESRRAVIEMALIAQNRPQFAAQAALHQHVQIFAILKRFVQFHNEFTVRLGHDLFFAHDVLLLACLDNLRFLHLFEGKRTRIVVAMQLDQLNASETANAQSGQYTQIGQLYGAEFFVDSVV